MKYMFIFFMLLPLNLLAETAKDIKDRMIKEKCLDIHGSSVVTKISDNQYEMRFRNGYGYGSAILLTRETVFSSKGRVVSLYVMNTGKKKMKTNDGFEKEFTVWVESKGCKSLGEKYSVALRVEHNAKTLSAKKAQSKKAQKKSKQRRVVNEKKKKFNSLYE